MEVDFGASQAKAIVSGFLDSLGNILCLDDWRVLKAITNNCDMDVDMGVADDKEEFLDQKQRQFDQVTKEVAKMDKIKNILGTSICG